MAAARRARSAADGPRAGHPGGAAGVARIHLRGPIPALRYTHLRSLFPYLPTQSGYNKRIRAAIGTVRAVIAHLVAPTSSVNDDVGVVDSTPVECGRSRETAKRSDLAGWAEYGYCASHSRFFGGCACTLCARCRVCRWRSPWPAPANARSCSACRRRPQSGGRQPESEVDGGQELLR
jgi:hypothetical protein